MPKVNLHRWSVLTAQVVYENSFDDDSGVFDVTIAARVIRDAGSDLIDTHVASMLVKGARTREGDRQ